MSDNLFPVAAGQTAMSFDDAIKQEAEGLAALPESRDTTLQYLKFVRGTWYYGREGEELEKDEVLIVNPLSLVSGWQGWEDGKPIAGPIVPTRNEDSLPLESSLPPIKPGDNNGWGKFRRVSVALVDDDGSRIDMQYQTGTYGGMEFMAKLKDVIRDGLREHPEAPICLVSLSKDSYTSKDNNKVFTPEFTVVGWADGNGTEVKKLAAA